MYRSFLCFFFILGSSFSYAQTSIKGATCVMTGIEYQYVITGDMDPSSPMTICVKGGLLLDNLNNCQALKPVSTVRVLWDSTATTGSISINCKSGNAKLNIDIIRPLNGGTIDTTRKSQSVDYGSRSLQINCSAPAGGSCDPVFEFQWQQSDNALVWTAIEGSKAQNLSFGEILKQTVFVRRRTLEKKSGTIAYSEVAAIYVGPKPGL